MEIDDAALFGFMQDVRGSLGKIDAKLEATNNHLQAVSGNVKEVRNDLSEHKEDVDAHGGKAITSRLGTVGGLLGAMAAAYELWKHK